MMTCIKRRNRASFILWSCQ